MKRIEVDGTLEIKGNGEWIKKKYYQLIKVVENNRSVKSYAITSVSLSQENVIYNQFLEDVIYKITIYFIKYK